MKTCSECKYISDCDTYALMPACKAFDNGSMLKDIICFFCTIALVFLILLGFCVAVYADPCINMKSIAQIESSNNPLAYNRHSKATGLYQITPIALKDYLQYHKNSDYTLSDMFNPDKAYEVSFWLLNIRIPQLLRHYRQPVTTENILKSYNAGHTYITQNKFYKETENYWRAYKLIEGSA
jgi:hypothetical protein